MSRQIRRTLGKIINISNIVDAVAIILLFLFSLWNIGTLNNIWILNDEFGYWSLAASFAGKDWTGLIPYTPYYSWGYSLLVAPLFLIFSSATTIYKSAIILNILLLIGSYVLSVDIGDKLLPKLNPILLRVFCFVISFYPNTMVQIQGAWTELLLIFLFWLTVWLLIEIVENPAFWKTLGYAITLGYMYTVHQRTIGIVIAGIIILIVLLLLKRLSFKDAVIVLAIVSGIIILVSLGKEQIKDALWVIQETKQESVMRNANDYKSELVKASRIFTRNGIIDFALGLSGRIYYLLIAGGPLFFWGAIQLIINSYALLKKILQPKQSREYQNRDIYALFLLMAIGASIVICIISINYKARYDMPFYARYFENTVPPILLIGLGAFYYDKKKGKKYIFYVILLLITMIFSIKMLGNVPQPNFFNSICAVSLGAYFWSGEKTKAIIIATILGLIITTIMCGLGKVKVSASHTMIQYKTCIVGAIVLLLSYWILSTYKVNEQYIWQRQSVQEPVYMITEVLESNKESTIYYIRNAQFDPYCRNAKFIQFLVPDRTIQVVDKESISEYSIELENAIILIETQDISYGKNMDEYEILKKTSLLTVCTQ